MRLDFSFDAVTFGAAVRVVGRQDPSARETGEPYGEKLGVDDVVGAGKLIIRESIAPRLDGTLRAPTSLRSQLDFILV